MISHRFLCPILATALFLGCCFTARGQSTFGSISGTVSDASGAAVPDAQVTLTNTATSAKETFTTGHDGLYSFVNLTPGEYRIDVEKPGFKHLTREPIVVQVQQSVRIDALMEV